MSQDDIPKVNSVNLSTRPDEVNWPSTIFHLSEMQNVTSEGKVKIPVKCYPALLYGLDYIVCQYIHEC